MTKRKVISSEQRFKINLEIGKHLMLLGNLSAGALVFGQTISGEFRTDIALIGTVVWIFLYIAAVFSMKGGVK